MSCPQCGQLQTLSDARFCPNCAFSLQAVKELLANCSAPRMQGPNAQSYNQSELHAHDNEFVTFAVGTPIEEIEQHMILRTLQKLGDNKTRTAEQLKISLKTLHNKLKQYGR